LIRIKAHRIQAGRMRAMPEKTLPASADTRALVLEVACRLFARHGRDGVAMREIAGASGLTMPTIYHHFKHKSGLYAACRTRVLEEAAAALRAALEASSRPDAAVQAFAVALCERLLGGRGLLLAFLLHDAASDGTAFDLLFTDELLARVDRHLDPSTRPRPGRARRLCAFACGLIMFARPARRSPASRREAVALARMLVAAATANSA
jgi:TetR/AcrR family transcriptional regulator